MRLTRARSVARAEGGRTGRFEGGGPLRAEGVVTAPTTALRWPAYALFGLAAMLMANSTLGPAGTDVIRYRMSATLVNQLIALDVVSFVLIAPLCVVAGVLVLRRHASGPVLALGPTAFTVYMTAQTIVGSDYLGVAGNNERWFPWHLGLFVLAVATLVGAWSQIDPSRLPSWSPRRRRRTAGALFAVAAFVAFGQWLPTLADITSSQPTRADYLESPAITWLIALLDLGLLVPAAVAAAVGLLLGAAWAGQAAYGVTGFLALVGPAVAAMAITMQVNGDPNAAVADAAVMTSVGLLLAALAVAVHLPLLRAAPSTGTPPTGTPPTGTPPTGTPPPREDLSPAHR